MSEYVPTTAEVRAAYVDGAGEYRDLAGDWFDRWLAKVRADAEFTAHTRTDVGRLVGALQAVLDIHRPKYHYPNLCDGCDPGIMDPPEWPCSTVLAIEAALQEGS